MNTAIIGAIVCFILAIIVAFTIPILRFRPWFKWWNSHQPKNGTKLKCLPLSLLAYRSSSTIVYDIVSLFVSEQNQVSEGWALDFFMSIMERWAVDIVPKERGYLTPSSMCFSIAPQPGEPGHDHPPVVTSGMGGYQGPDFTAWPADLLGNKEYDQFGQDVLWRAVLASWGITQASPDDINKGIFVSGTWNDAPSNFLSNIYKMPCNSDLIGAFLTGLGNSPKDGHKMFPEGFRLLMGIQTLQLVGGWVGFTKSAGEWGGMGYDEMWRQIWAENHPSVPDAANPVKKSTGSCLASAGSQGLSMGGAGAFLGAALAGAGPAGWFIAAGGALFGAIGFGLGWAENKCGEN